MDESHRLKPMAKDFNEEVFVRIFNETKLLRNKLAFQIDHRRFGVDNKDILSAFDIKFIWAFNKFIEKYGIEDVGNLKGYIINSLKQYQFRLMRSSYQPKYIDHVSMIDITSMINETEIEQDNPSISPFLDVALSFIKERVSDNAMMILELELNPPEWIASEMEYLNKSKNAKIPSDLIAEYFNLGSGELVINYINSLRQEIAGVIKLAKDHFKDIPVLG